MELIECSCLGGNENCYKCYGKGFIENNSESWPKKNSATFKKCTLPSSIKMAKGKSDYTGYSYFFVRNTDGSLEKMEAYAPVVKEVIPEFVSCKYCGGKVKNKSLINHFKKYHAESYELDTISTKKGDGLTNKPPLTKSKKSRNSKKNTINTLCKICKCKLKLSNLGKHLEKVHKLHFRENKPSLNPEDLKIFDNDLLANLQPEITEKFFDLGNFDRLDSTKGYAHAFREHGQYGSHPVHDDYDEVDNY